MRLHGLLYSLHHSTLQDQTKDFLRAGESFLTSHKPGEGRSAADVNKLISSMRAALTVEYVTAHPPIPQAGKDLQKLEKVVRLFIQQLGKLPKEVAWDTDLLTTPIIDHNLEELLEAFRAGTSLTHRVTTSLPEELDADAAARSLRKFSFAKRFGLGGLVPTGAGQTGTSWATKAGGKKVGICKPGWKQTPLVAKIKNLVKMLTIGQLSRLPRGMRRQPQAETAAYLLDRAYEMNTMPPTRMLEDGTAFQLSAQKFIKKNHESLTSSTQVKFGENLVEGKEAAGLALAEVRSFKPSELTLWQDFVAHDYFCGNLDCHDENYFIYQDPETLEILGVVGIDKANSFPVKDVEIGEAADRNRYDWRHQGISQKKFTPDSIAKMEEMALTWKSTVEGINRDHPELEQFFSPEVQDLMQLRAEVLGRAAQIAKTATGFSPAQLGEIRSRRQMIAFLKADYMPISAQA